MYASTFVIAPLKDSPAMKAGINTGSSNNGLIKVVFKPEKEITFLCDHDCEETLSSDKFQHLLKTFLMKSKENRQIISQSLGSTFVILNGAIYSTNISANRISFPIPENHPEFGGLGAKSISIVQDCELERSCHYDILNQLMGRFFKVVMKKIKLKQVGRKMFNSEKAVKVNNFEIWPGFNTSLVLNQTFSLLNVDIASKIITNKFLNNVFNQYLRTNQHDIESVLHRELVGKSVMTVYNKRFYVIDGIAINMNAHSSFSNSEGVTKTFVEYYKEKYNIEIGSPQYPLIVSKDGKTKTIVYLISELCVLTGLSDEERADRNLMKDIDAIAKPSGSNRLKNSILY